MNMMEGSLETASVLSSSPSWAPVLFLCSSCCASLAPSFPLYLLDKFVYRERKKLDLGLNTSCLNNIKIGSSATARPEFDIAEKTKGNVTQPKIKSRAR